MASSSSKILYLLFSSLIVIFYFFKTSVDAKTDPEVIIGIDLGTTYSCVGVMQKTGNVHIVPNEIGKHTTPSIVAISGKEFLIGESGRSHMRVEPSQTIFDPKRFIGRSWAEVLPNVSKYPFKVLNKNGKPVFEILYDGKPKMFTPEEISAKILIKMKEIAEAFVGKPVNKAVITVPAYFNDSQRQATKDAGQIAGLEVVRIINEPTAAAIAYGFDKRGSAKILVFDLGGGTFDVSLLELEDGVFEVKAVNGNTYLGGQDFDERIMAWAGDLCQKKFGVDIKQNPRLLNKFRNQAESVKIALSSVTSTFFEVDGIKGGEAFSETLTRAKFEEICKDLFLSTLDPVKQVLEDAKWSKKDVDEILLVGGSSRIPKVQSLLIDLFNGKELNKSVHPDEAVAHGATIQAGVLMGTEATKDILVIDATALTLGIETLHGVFTPLIDRNTAIPTRKSQIFSTADDNQTQVTIKVYEGERKFARDNHLLGTFDLTGIPLAPRGVPKIEVTFEVDVNGILTVTAKDQGSGNSQSIRISNEKGRLSQAEIDRMIKEAEVHQEEDKRRKELVDAQDQFERYVYQLKDQVNDSNSIGGKISESEKTEIINAVDEGMKWFESNKKDAKKEDYEEQKSKIEKIVAPIVTRLYGEAQGAPEPEQTGHEDL